MYRVGKFGKSKVKSPGSPSSLEKACSSGVSRFSLEKSSSIKDKSCIVGNGLPLGKDYLSFIIFSLRIAEGSVEKSN